MLMQAKTLFKRKSWNYLVWGAYAKLVMHALATCNMTGCVRNGEQGSRKTGSGAALGI